MPTPLPRSAVLPSAVLLLLLLPRPALASDFGCVAEYVGLATLLAPVVGAAWAVCARWTRTGTHHLLSGLGAVGTLVLLAATDCPYGQDPDAFGTGMTLLGLLAAVGGGHLLRASAAAKTP